MTRPRVYVETSIPSLYHDGRESPAVREMREITRRWWAWSSSRCELVTSVTVHRELLSGPAGGVVDWIEFFDGIPMLRVNPETVRLANLLIENRVMPAEPPSDAYHVAIAMNHACDLLVTRDRKHLANPRKAVHLRTICRQYGAVPPTILTPREFLERHE